MITARPGFFVAGIQFLTGNYKEINTVTQKHPPIHKKLKGHKGQKGKMADYILTTWSKNEELKKAVNTGMDKRKVPVFRHFLESR